jgi:hypothetical protein
VDGEEKLAQNDGLTVSWKLQLLNVLGPRGNLHAGSLGALVCTCARVVLKCQHRMSFSRSRYGMLTNSSVPLLVWITVSEHHGDGHGAKEDQRHRHTQANICSYTHVPGPGNRPRPEALPEASQTSNGRN